MGVKGFVEGGIASIVAGCSTHPLDLIKVRMQLQGESQAAAAVPQPALRPALAFQAGAQTVALPHAAPAVPKPGPIGICTQILRAEGAAGLFSGISATMLRQTLYSTTRMGLYDILKKRWTQENAGVLPLHRKIAAGLIAGGVGAAVGNPADLAMVRMQADGRLPLADRRNYRSVGDAIARMTRDEGVRSLWRGSALTVNRAMIVTASQLATYDQAKEAILARRGPGADGLGTHVAASFAAGIVAAAASNPVQIFLLRRHAVLLTTKADRHAASPMSVGRAFDAQLHSPAHLLRVTSHDPEDFLVHFELPAHRDNAVRLGSINVDGVCFDIKPWHEDDHTVIQDFLLHVRGVIEKMPMQLWSVEGTAKVLGDKCTIDRLDSRTHERGHTRTFACWVWVWDVAFIPTRHTIWRAARGAGRVEAMLGFSPPSREVAPPPRVRRHDMLIHVDRVED